MFFLSFIFYEPKHEVEKKQDESKDDGEYKILWCSLNLKKGSKKKAVQQIEEEMEEIAGHCGRIENTVAG